METISKCPVCSGSEFAPFLSCLDHTVSRETFSIVKCGSCGFRFTNPRPDEGEIGKYYQSEAYISHSGTTKGIVNRIYGIARNYTVRKKVKWIHDWSRQAGSKNILDIGCGTGEFLNACQQYGWNVTGIEPSETARENAEKNLGLTFYPNLEAIPARDKDGAEVKFNVITLWHVLEHVHQLHRTIERISSLLHTEGVLVIAVPNCNSWDAEHYGKYWAAWDVPRHLYHFTKRDIESLFSGFNFELKGIHPMKLDSYYVSLLSEKYQSGTANLFRGFLNGLRSNLSARKNNRGNSSQIFVLEKK